MFFHWEIGRLELTSLIPAELDTIQLCSARLLEAVNYIFWAKEEEKEQKHRWEDSEPL